MTQKFKVGDKVHHFAKGYGIVVGISRFTTDYPVKVNFSSDETTCFTLDGRLYTDEEPYLRLTGRPFNEGDRVVIGGQKFVITCVFKDALSPASVQAVIGDDEIWITPDGRAWPNTPIICEHDWEQGEEEAEILSADSAPAKPGADDVAESSDLTPKYIKMALALEGIEVDLMTADLIGGVVDGVRAFGDEYSISHSCAIRRRIGGKYAGSKR